VSLSPATESIDFVLYLPTAVIIVVVVFHTRLWVTRFYFTREYYMFTMEILYFLIVSHNAANTMI
jgi:hypothetical protein